MPSAAVRRAALALALLACCHGGDGDEHVADTTTDSPSPPSDPTDDRGTDPVVDPVLDPASDPVVDPSADPVVDPGPELADADVVDAAADPWTPPFADVDFCDEVAAFGPVFGADIARWRSQDDAASPPPPGLLLVGSSSARRWEDFARLHADRTPMQRGFGGAQLGEVALSAYDLITRHDPAAVAVFAGTNDVAAGVEVDVVVERFRCLRQRIGTTLGWETPVFFIGITPTPARWSGWDRASAVNDAVRALAEDDLGAHYIDIPTPFLATGSPPDAALFVGDRLHLSDAGYALWNDVIRGALDGALGVPVAPPSATRPLALGETVLLDVGPNDDAHGEATPAPDYLGRHWNNWHPTGGGTRILPGEHVEAMVTATGEATDVRAVVTGGFGSNGWANGGLRWPDPELLGDLAVGSATGDFWYADGGDLPGGIAFYGLRPGQPHTVRLFASRGDDETRTTRFTVHGVTSATRTVRTSGPDAGAGSANDREITAFDDVVADAYGALYIDVDVDQGAYAYLSLVEITAR